MNGAPIEHDWYRLLFNQIIRKSPSFFSAQAHRLSIITFNFDRSLECALATALRHAFNLAPGETASCRKNC
jgi:predicted oxidoreductase (fatty acid repression mutant protein)